MIKKNISFVVANFFLNYYYMSIFFDSLDEVFNQLNQDWNNLDILQKDEEDICIEGRTLLQYLNIKEDINDIISKKCILLEGPNDNTILVIYTDVKQNIDEIWNWKLFLILANEYCIINKEPLEYTPTKWFTKVINNNFTFCNSIDYLHKNKDVNNLKLIKKSRERAIRTALQCILIGGNGFEKNIVTDIDGEYLFSLLPKNLSLSIFKHMYSASSIGQNECVLFSFIPMTCESYGYSIDGYPLSELLEQGLIEKLEEFFNNKETNLIIEYKQVDNNICIIVKW